MLAPPPPACQAPSSTAAAVNAPSCDQHRALEQCQHTVVMHMSRVCCGCVQLCSHQVQTHIAYRAQCLHGSLSPPLHACHRPRREAFEWQLQFPRCAVCCDRLITSLPRPGAWRMVEVTFYVTSCAATLKGKTDITKIRHLLDAKKIEYEEVCGTGGAHSGTVE